MLSANSYTSYVEYILGLEETFVTSEYLENICVGIDTLFWASGPTIYPCQEKISKFHPKKDRKPLKSFQEKQKQAWNFQETSTGIQE